MSVVTGGQAVEVGAVITAAIYDPGNLTERFGAQVEKGYTREIVSAWHEAELREGLWWVQLDGVLEAGVFNLVWMTADAPPPDYEVFIPLAVGAAGTGTGAGLQPVYGENFPPVPRAEVTPSVDEVAKLERTRTVDEYGNELETFTDETRPTAEEALAVIEAAVDDVLASLPGAYWPALYESTKRVVAMRAAQKIEASFFDPPASGNKPWEEEYTTARDKLEETIVEARTQNNLLGTLEPRPPARLT